MNPFAIWDTARNSMPDDGSGTGAPGWYPAQSAHGVLPMASTPGSMPPSLIGKPILTFRFMARGQQSNMSVVGPNFRPCFRILTNTAQTYIHTPTGPIAIVHWEGPDWNSTDPIVERTGQQMKASVYLPEALDAQGRRVRRMMIGPHHYMWTFDNKGFYIHPYGSPEHVLGFVYNNNGVELRVVDEGISTEFVNSMVTAVVVMQGKVFAGL